ncbi:MAG: hypothetical protein ACI9C4_000632 [Paraglaciecola sp.]|jgi:hypothetical protein
MKFRQYHCWLLGGLLTMVQAVFATPTQIMDVEREFLPQSYQILDGPEQQVLLITSQATTALTRGVAVLVSESGISPVSDRSLAPLAKRLNGIGWVTMLVAAPAVGLVPLSEEAIPDDKQNSSAPQETFSSQASYQKTSQMDSANFLQHQARLVTSMQLIVKQSRQYPGFLLVIAQGTSAAWLTKIYAEQALPPPDALVVISPFWPARQYNSLLANQVAMTTMPVLDIYHTRDNNWSLQSANERKISALKALKLHYRQREMSALDDPAQNARQLNKQIYGWLHYLGW